MRKVINTAISVDGPASVVSEKGIRTNISRGMEEAHTEIFLLFSLLHIYPPVKSLRASHFITKYSQSGFVDSKTE